MKHTRKKSTALPNQARKNDGLALHPGSKDFKDLYGSLSHGGKAATVKEMNQSIARAAAASYSRSVER